MRNPALEKEIWFEQIEVAGPYGNEITTDISFTVKELLDAIIFELNAEELEEVRDYLNSAIAEKGG